MVGAQPSYLDRSCRRCRDTVPWSDFGSGFGCWSEDGRRAIVGALYSNGIYSVPTWAGEPRSAIGDDIVWDAVFAKL